jgi:hypothetical protein
MVLVAWTLAGCAAGGDGVSSMLVTPGAYNTYDCVQLENAVRGHRQKIVEMEQLMARAAKGPGGDFVNAVTYRSEYEFSRGQYKELMRAAADKNCPAQSKWSSERSVF